MINTNKIFTWFIKWWYTDVPYAGPITEWWLIKVKLWYSTRGFLWTIAHIKSIRLHYTRFISGHPLHKPNGTFAVGPDGLPTDENLLNSLLETNRGKSLLLTLLSISRCLPTHKKPDLSSIIDPWNGKIPDGIEEFIPQFINDNNLSEYKSNFTLLDLVNSVKSGPLGSATLTSILQTKECLYRIKEELVQLTGGYPEDLVILGRKVPVIPNILKPLEKWAHIAHNYQSVLTKELAPSNKGFMVTSLRKLSLIFDPEGKCRIICIFDYWSQSALRPLHNWALSQLRKIPADRTYDQDPFKLTNKGPYYSIDLTSATDRFPIKLQELLLAKLTSAAFASNWVSILTKVEVWVPWEIRHIKYATGQPMGAYSSWAIFSLTHHLLIQFAAHKVGKSNFMDYIMLGDDVVIADKAVAEMYMELLKELGVETSDSKTHISDHTYEFAKRWIHKGYEISPLPTKGLIASWRQYHLLVPLIYSILQRSTTARYCTAPDLCFDLFLIMGLHKRLSRNLYNHSEKFAAIWKWLKDEDPYHIFNLVKRHDKEFHPFPEPNSSDGKEYIDWLLQRTVTREIMNNIEEIKATRVNLITKFSKLCDSGSLISQILPDLNFQLQGAIHYHPTLISVKTETGRLEDELTKLMKEKDWIGIFKITTIPNPEELLLAKDRKDKVSQSVAKFAKDVFKTADMQRKKDTWFLAQFD